MSEHDEPKSQGNRPVEVMRDGALRLAIFRNRDDQGDNYAMVPGRIYTDKETGKVHEASSLAGSEPLRMANLLTRGYERVGEFRTQAKEEAKKREHDERER